MIKLELKRTHYQHYETLDGEYMIWKELYAPYRWYVNRKGYDETEVAEGFRLKRQALLWLQKKVKERIS